ncbi:MAG: C40 family peptidase [Nocardioides sp.]
MSRPHPLYGHPDVREVAVPVATMWTSPEAPRPLDADAVADLPDMATWTTAMDAETRLELHGRTLTQLLLGEGVLVLEHHGEWSRVAALMQGSSAHEHGYPGWVRTAHLDRPVPRWTGPSAFVAVPVASCILETTGEELPLSCGTGLWVDSVREETVGVLLPGGRRGSVPLDAVRLGHKRQQQTYGPDDLLATARQFLGTRYLWGGTSAWGLDCSGLVHLTLRAHTVPLPRDAFDQADATRAIVPVDVADVQPGDLYFFARPGQRVYHVGFATSPVAADGTRWMLHAPEGGGLIEDAPMADDRLEVLVSAGRVRKPDTRQLATYHGDESDGG